MFPANSIASSSSFNWYSPSPDPNFNSIRGKACGECRRRKVKCDGGLPVCGRCAAASHEEDCEYVPEDGLTRSEMLEQDIEVLQARIRELEARPKHERSAHPGLYSSGSPHPSSAIRNPSRRSTPDIVLPEVLHVFFQHASQLGVFLNRSRLTEALYALPHNSILRIPPHPTYSPFLFRAIFLLGLRLSNPEVSQAHEPALLAKTIQASIAPSQPEYILSHMQAEVLLAHYFLIQGRLIEAMDRINAAVSLGIGSSLYETSATTGVTSFAQLSPSWDEMMQTERANALTTLFVLHKTWGVALQWPPTIPEFAIQIDSFSPGSLNSLNETVAIHARLSRLAKAASLYDRATSMSTRANTPRISSTDAFQELDRALFDFLRAMHPLDYAGVASLDSKRQHFVTYTLAQVAVIRLYGNISDIMSVQKCLVAALSVSAEIHRIPDLMDWQFVDPLVGTLLLPVSQILIRGILTASSENGGPDSLVNALRQVTDAMSVLGQLCPFIGHQMVKIHSLYPPITYTGL